MVYINLQLFKPCSIADIVCVPLISTEHAFPMPYPMSICFRMSQDKLVYFPVRARAEATRMLYALAGKSLTDEKVTFEQWGGGEKASKYSQWCDVSTGSRVT